MKKRISLMAPLYFLLILSLVLTGEAFAEGPPINTDTAIISGFEAAFRSFLQYTRKSGEMPGGKTGRLSVVTVPIAIPYEISPNRLLFVGVIPYMDIDLKVESNGTSKRLTNSGFGDSDLTLKYLLYQKDSFQETTRALVTGGIKLPTGDSDRPGIPPGLQRGSGSFDYHAGAVFTHIKERVGMSADLVYKLKTEANDFRAGNTLNYDLALGYRLLPMVYRTYPSKELNIYLELNGVYNQKDKQNGVGISDSGGNTIFLSPGIQFIAGRAFLVEASFQIPILQNLYGTQLETDYSFLVGFRWLLW